MLSKKKPSRWTKQPYPLCCEMCGAVLGRCSKPNQTGHVCGGCYATVQAIQGAQTQYTQRKAEGEDRSRVLTYQSMTKQFIEKAGG